MNSRERRAPLRDPEWCLALPRGGQSGQVRISRRASRSSRRWSSDSSRGSTGCTTQARSASGSHRARRRAACMRATWVSRLSPATIVNVSEPYRPEPLPPVHVLAVPGPTAVQRPVVLAGYPGLDVEQVGRSDEPAIPVQHRPVEQRRRQAGVHPPHQVQAGLLRGTALLARQRQGPPDPAGTRSPDLLRGERTDPPDAGDRRGGRHVHGHHRLTVVDGEPHRVVRRSLGAGTADPVHQRRLRKRLSRTSWTPGREASREW